MQKEIESLSIIPLLSPSAVKQAQPLSSNLLKKINDNRQKIKQIIKGHDSRLLVVVGPCSIHDKKIALEYASKLTKIADKLSEKLLIVMRTYFEKPRTTIGWRGFLTDPHLDGSYDINTGLKIARELLISINEAGLPTATEFLDTIIPSYFSDLISWVAMGARTSESQIHRELASGLMMPVGFKNSTSGNIQSAIDAVCVANHAHSSLVISENGQPILVKTNGNPDCHITLRGSNTHSNYSTIDIEESVNKLKMHALTPRLMIDCSHGNTGKNYELQSRVVDSVCEQLKSGSKNILGIMLESNLIAGKQTFQTRESLLYGQSITDACLSWNETVPLLEKLASVV